MRLKPVDPVVDQLDNGRLFKLSNQGCPPMGPIAWGVAKQRVDSSGSRFQNRGKRRSEGGSFLG